MSTTPRTDAECRKPENAGRVNAVLPTEFARQLELELAEARKDSERLDWLTRYWDSQCVGLQPMADPRYYPNPTGSVRDAIDAARDQEQRNRSVAAGQMAFDAQLQPAAPLTNEGVVLVCPTCNEGKYAELYPSKTDPTGYTLYCRRCEEGCVSPKEVKP